MISVRINGEEKEITTPQTVRELLKFLKIQNRSIAVAINNEILPRSEIDTRQICHGDQIEVVQPVGGG
ncbi:MAG: sulfur carrier protein ThiS [Deltaproteobacteria bacterium]|nr:sulfur carrier protein ThiS [Deltaproteobacteria bacterium]